MTTMPPPVVGEACDVILIPHSNPNCACACSDFVVQFPDSYTTTEETETLRISISVNGNVCREMDMYITHKGCRFRRGDSLKPPREALNKVLQHTVKGKNSLRYSLIQDQVVIARAQANLFLWNVENHVIVCDIDGTITKSNARGVLDTMVLESYAYAHDGVCEFLTSLVTMDDSLRVLYLTSRPISFAQTTRKFLQGLQQDDFKLPQGPLFMHPGTLSTVLYSELVSKDVHSYKSDKLMRQVVLTFAAAGRDNTRSLLVSGFGNALTDSVAYEMAGISRDNIYMIDKKSQISCMNKDLLHTIHDEVKVNSQGSLEVTPNSERSIVDTDSEREQAISRREQFATTGTSGGKKKRSSRKQRKSLHRQYTALIGSSYNGYHDANLLQDVINKILSTMEEE